MDIRRLEAFAKVYELGSFSKAASEMFLSQPTISTHVAGLESELEAVLFDRMGRKVLPTQAADILYSHVEKIFESMEAARAEIAALQERVSGKFAIGGSTIPAHYLIPELIAEFRETYPEVRVSLRVGDTEKITDMVADGELMCGITGAELDRPDLEFKQFIKDSMVVIAAPALMKGKNRISARRLPDYPWISREQGSGTRRAIESAMESAGIDRAGLNTAMVVESTQAVIQFVRAGLGISATSRLAAAEYLESGALTEVRIENLEMERWFYLVSHRRRHFFPAVRKFIDFVEEKARP